MNAAHLHLLINHFPVMGGIIATLILLAGIVLKNETVKKVAYFVFVASALVSIPTHLSGERAEEIVENIKGIDENMIEHHEEKADFAMWSSIVTGIISLIALYLSFKSSQLRGVLSFVVLMASIITIFFVWGAGSTGGKIRHTEITNTAAPQPASANPEQDND